MNDRIIDKIQKLLALSTSSNVNEAATAAALAQELMTRHQIEVADIEFHTSKGGDVQVENEELTREKSYIPWKVSLAAGLAKANGCSVYTQNVYPGSSIKKMIATRFIGTSSSISVVRYMYAYLVREIDRLAAENREGHDRIWLKSFRLGAVASITTRLIQASKEVVKEATPGALVVIDKTASKVEEACKALNLKQGKQIKTQDYSGFQEGVKAGRTVNLSVGKPLSKGSSGELKV